MEPKEQDKSNYTNQHGPRNPVKIDPQSTYKIDLHSTKDGIRLKVSTTGKVPGQAAPSQWSPCKDSYIFTTLKPRIGTPKTAFKKRIGTLKTAFKRRIGTPNKASKKGQEPLEKLAGNDEVPLVVSLRLLLICSFSRFSLYCTQKGIPQDIHSPFLILFGYKGLSKEVLSFFKSLLKTSYPFSLPFYEHPKVLLRLV